MKYRFLNIILLIQIVSLFAEPLYNELGLKQKRIKYACKMLSEMDSLFLKYFDSEIDNQIAKAVVYPEIYRFNPTQDYAEQLLNNKLNYDFSVGLFQIKPSFLDKIDLGNLELITAEEKVKFLSETENQVLVLKYFIDFFRINNDIIDYSIRDQIRIMATAYTFGKMQDVESLVELAKIETWFSRDQQKSRKYSYAEIALFYYDYSMN